jgi:hypothetical protein
LAKPNYSFDKRQRELKKAKQQEEKRQKKQASKPAGTGEGDSSRPAQDKPSGS